MVSFKVGEYGFNKSHSTAYGLIAYHTAYLKAHYPVHYMTAMLTSEVNNTDKLIKYITECRDSGIEILPPDINESNKPFTISTISKRSIRYGLSGIKNVGDAAIDHILEIRQRVGGFNSFTQFISLIDSRKVNKKVLESLAKAGCFDSLGLKRSQVLYIIKGKTEAIQKRPVKTSYKQMAIFGTDTEDEQRLEVPDMEELPHEEVISGETEAFVSTLPSTHSIQHRTDRQAHQLTAKAKGARHHRIFCNSWYCKWVQGDNNKTCIQDGKHHAEETRYLGPSSP
jgi:DNA polymerase-3 subunit alpha